ncbi:hypothetical protein QFZ34_001503 [Phyllobacterium ifriqiyense]|uniref:Uncharacterized protein n=1 Tax=Phyllobacterium ifriqiyense TaxID=314238 RepID=A0ABU0S6Q5_9HYPH|nr:hypothetical protein [Phyllobacterium ifriqiyense]
MPPSQCATLTPLTQLDMRYLKLYALAGYDGIVLTPIELECFVGVERQQNENATTSSCCSRCLSDRHLVQKLQPGHARLRNREPPDPHEAASLSCAVCGTCLCLRPARQFVGKGIKLARSFGGFKDEVRLLIDNNDLSHARTCPWSAPTPRLTWMNVGPSVPAFKYFAIVLRESPVLRPMSRIHASRAMPSDG